MPDVELDDVLARDDEEGSRELLRILSRRSVDGSVQAHEERHQHEANAKYMPTLAEEAQSMRVHHREAQSANLTRKSEELLPLVCRSPSEICSSLEPDCVLAVLRWNFPSGKSRVADRRNL